MGVTILMLHGKIMFKTRSGIGKVSFNKTNRYTVIAIPNLVAPVSQSMKILKPAYYDWLCLYTFTKSSVTDQKLFCFIHHRTRNMLFEEPERVTYQRLVGAMHGNGPSWWFLVVAANQSVTWSDHQVNSTPKAHYVPILHTSYFLSLICTIILLLN